MRPSIATAQPAPTVTTSRPPTAGPSTETIPRCIEISTLAGWSWWRGTSCGITLASAGKLIAATVPLIALSTASCHSSAVPLITRPAIASWVTPARTLETWMTSVRPNRSAITPPASRNSTSGMLCAASTIPSAEGELLTSSTAKASAMPPIVEPAPLTRREKK